ncbi:MAG: hypothetical protein H6823_25525 [Planctomycetaceae bacterium]|nr:hypothetical protein [Planctomycetales bacterium]MCB9941611.1 hypothetical protein [Planctomycetaceae bacterium]
MTPRSYPWAHAPRSFLSTMFVLALVAKSLPGFSSEPISVVGIEEDWELVVESPDPNSTAPQVSCTISPLSHVDSIHAAFELNHQSQPEFTAGGLQLQVWNDEQPLSSRKFPNTGVLSHDNEVVRWTQSLTLDDGTLTFEISNGTSTTWGQFGGQGYLKASLSTNLVSLNGYDPAVSVQNSGVAYAGNRVTKLVLKRVRATLSTGEVIEDPTERFVHTRD